MMSKRTFSFLPFFAFLLFPKFLLGQSAEEKLLDAYGEERVSELQNEHPKKYDYLLFKLEHGYRVTSVREGKGYPKLEEVPYFKGKAEDPKVISASELARKLDNGTFNFLMCRLERSKEFPKAYELKGTGKVLVLFSEDRLARKFNER